MPSINERSDRPVLTEHAASQPQQTVMNQSHSHTVVFFITFSVLLFVEATSNSTDALNTHTHSHTHSTVVPVQLTSEVSKMDSERGQLS